MVSTVIGADGSRTQGAASDALVEMEVRRRLEERYGEADSSLAERRLKRLRLNQQVELVRRVQVPFDEECWWIKRGSFADLALVAMLSGRDSSGQLQLESGDAVSGFIAAVLLALVVDGPEERAPFFEDLGQARAFCADPCPQVADTVATLFYGAVDLNPEVWPEAEASAKKVWRALGQQGAAQSWSWPPSAPTVP